MRFTSSVLASFLLLTVCNASENPKSTTPSHAHSGANSVQQLIELTPPDGAQDGYFGESVAISSAGNTVAVESFNNAAGGGAIYVYEKPATGWQNATLSAELTVTGAQWLYPPVVMSPDGSTIVASGYVKNQLYAQVYVFLKPADGWVNMTQTAILHATHGGASNFGYAIATDGDDILVGSLGCSGNGDFSSGEAYLFVKPAGGWTDMTQTGLLEETDPIGCDRYGDAVAIQGDTAVVGRSGGGMTPPVAPGALYVFTKPAGGWGTMSETAKLTGHTNGLTDYLGATVALSGGTILAPLTLPSSTTTGAYIYTEPAGGWVNGTQTATLTNTNKGVTSIGNGSALDGSTAAVIAEYQDGTSFALTLYDEPAGGWQNASTPNVTVFPSDEAAGDYFGTHAVAISGGTIVIGAQGATRNGIAREGAAYIFQQN